MTINQLLKKTIDFLSSLKLTLVCLGLMMVVVFFGTLDQVHLGTFSAQKKYFDAFFVRDFNFFGFLIPIFPGGLGVGMLWLINLLAAHGSRFSWNKKKMGILIIHSGLLILILGQFLTQTLSQETQMAIQEGETKSYSEAERKMELVLVNTSNSRFDEVTAIPESIFSQEGQIENTGLPFQVVIRKYFPNATLSRQSSNSSSGLKASMGIGSQISVEENPPTTSDEMVNNSTAFVEILDANGSKGIWLLSSALGAEQSFVASGNSYKMMIRHERHYFDFSLTLKDFRHDLYLGTDVPKNFSSLLHLDHPANGENRDVLIYMNHPLRYEGKTFFQASFGQNDTVSIFQVVENPVWVTPYISCVLVTLGLMLQFVMHLVGFFRKRS